MFSEHKNFDKFLRVGLGENLRETTFLVDKIDICEASLSSAE